MKPKAAWTAVYALYAEPQSARRAVEALMDAKISPHSITVLSSEPWDEYELGSQQDGQSWMPWLAALGGVLGGVAGYGLAAGTQKAWELPTGGMAIVPNWTNGIITYEVTMLGAILTTLVVLLAAARLPSWRRQLYDPAVSEGKILVGITAPGAQVPELESLLHAAGRCDVRVVGGEGPARGS